VANLPGVTILTPKTPPFAISGVTTMLEMMRVAGPLAADDSVDSAGGTAKNHPPRLSIPSKNP
jgi:hypothetical protein